MMFKLIIILPFLDNDFSTVFGEFVSHQMDLYRKMEATRNDNHRLKAENEAKDIKIKLSR